MLRTFLLITLAAAPANAQVEAVMAQIRTEGFRHDYVHEEDLKPAAVIVAAVAYQTAMLDEKIPGKALLEER